MPFPGGASFPGGLFLSAYLSLQLTPFRASVVRQINLKNRQTFLKRTYFGDSLRRSDMFLGATVTLCVGLIRTPPLPALAGQGLMC